MKPYEFKAWRKRHQLSAHAAAQVLGIKEPRTIRRYESGDIPVSGPVARLCLMIQEVLRIYSAKVAGLGIPGGVQLVRPSDPEALKSVETVASLLERAGIPVTLE